MIIQVLTVMRVMHLKRQERQANQRRQKKLARVNRQIRHQRLERLKQRNLLRWMGPMEVMRTPSQRPQLNSQPKILIMRADLILVSQRRVLGSVRSNLLRKKRRRILRLKMKRQVRPLRLIKM